MRIINEKFEAEPWPIFPRKGRAKRSQRLAFSKLRDKFIWGHVEIPPPVWKAEVKLLWNGGPQKESC